MRCRIQLLSLAVLAWIVGNLLWASNRIEAREPAWPWPLSADDQTALPPEFRVLVPLHKRLQKPAPGDWLDKHFEEGQSYREYLKSFPIRTDRERNVLWIHPLGEFSPAERKVVKITSDFLNACYQLPVKTSEDLSLSLIPNSARRTRNEKLQIQSTYVLDQVLKPRLPNDAVASIAFTSTDLWPGEGWNFVFGQASLEERVGVWSIHRFGNAQGSDAAAVKQMLRRTLKTAVHETGHMFSMQHCVYYACVMNGSNHLEEADRQPLWFCPECSAKLCYATGAEPKLQYEQLVQFAEKNQFEAERELWVRSLQLFKEK